MSKLYSKHCELRNFCGAASCIAIPRRCTT